MKITDNGDIFTGKYYFYLGASRFYINEKTMHYLGVAQYKIKYANLPSKLQFISPIYNPDEDDFRDENTIIINLFFDTIFKLKALW